MTEEDDPGLPGDALPECDSHGFGICQRERQFIIDILEALLFRKEPPGAVQHAIFVIGRQRFIPWSQLEAVCNNVSPAGSINGENQVVRLSTQVVRQIAAGFLQQARCKSIEEFNRLFFQFELSALLGFKYR